MSLLTELLNEHTKNKGLILTYNFAINDTSVSIIDLKNTTTDAQIKQMFNLLFPNIPSGMLPIKTSKKFKRHYNITFEELKQKGFYSFYEFFAEPIFDDGVVDNDFE